VALLYEVWPYFIKCGSTLQSVALLYEVGPTL
jgi:hypothetical protein